MCGRMLTAVALTLALTSGAPGQSPGGAGKLQGTWVGSAEVAGKVNAFRGKFVFTKDTVTLQKVEGPMSKLTFNYRVGMHHGHPQLVLWHGPLPPANSTERPALEMRFYYVLEGDTLTLSSEVPGAPRLASFTRGFHIECRRERSP